MTKRLLWLWIACLPLLLQAQSSDLFPMVPGTPVVHSAKSTGIFRGTPSIVRLPTGELLTSNDVFSNTNISNRTDIFISRNDGVTWSYKATVPGAVWSGLFVHNAKLYLMGGDTSNGSNFVIRTSSDKGTTWSAATVLIPGACHGSSTPVLRANGRIYKAYEHHFADNGNKWMSGNMSFIISAPENADLMNKNSWTVTNEIAKPAWVDGTGWLESNAVIGRDGKIKGISRLASIEGIYAGYYSLESEYKIEEGSARKIQFYGGASKFNINYDPKTDLYYSLANYVPDALRGENISAGGLRSVLALTTSYDLEEWTIKSIVLASTDVVNVGFQYVDWIFDGDDILFVSRTSYPDGLGGADNFHNSNFMTFHRIANYATATTAPEWEYLLPNDKWNGVIKKFDATNGKGDTQANPILISHPGELVYLSEQVYQGNNYANKYFLMTQDIDLNHKSWLPIGWYINLSTFRAFSGHFDGGGHRILNLKIGRHDDVYSSSGIFGYTLGGSISNLGLDGESAILVGGASAGIVSMADATIISNCYNAANIKGTSQAAGILAYGVHSPSIINCYNKGKIELNTNLTNAKYIGGIVGYLNSTAVLRNSYNVGAVVSLSESSIGKGGVVGAFTGNIQHCYYSAESVSGNSLGIAKRLSEMQSISFFNLINAGQSLASWKSDYVTPINNNLPILSWENNSYTGIIKPEISNTNVLMLGNCFPNPAEEIVNFPISLAKAGFTSLIILKLTGEKIAIVHADYLQEGMHRFSFNVNALATGIYLYQLNSGGNIVTKLITVK